MACFAASAQLDTGNVSGTVSDPSGAAIPQAGVRLTSELTGTVRTAVTSEQGYYTFPLVPSGRYAILVERPGFKTFQRSGITLQVNQQINVPVTLTVGEVSEQVSVSGTAVLVETTSGAIRETVDHQRVTELPLNGRNVLQLQSLLPGTVPTGSLDQGANTPGFSVNGGIGASNNYSLDGGQHQDAYFNSPLPFPNPDAIQEFSVQTNSYSAEFGRNRGASVNAVTKSGTNQFHGGAFEFLRNDILDARPFFSREAPVFKRNQFGAHLGGPIRPNKTFFFFAWQSTRERGTPNTSTATVPTARMRSGDFSELTRTVRDPQTGQPFPGNIVPADRLNQPALRFLERYVPLPNFGAFNYVTPLNRPLDGDEYVTRIDHDFGSSDRIYGRYLFNKDQIFGPAGNFPGWGIDQGFRRQSAVINETHIFTPAALNSFTFTFNRVKSDVVPLPQFPWSDFGANIPDAASGISGWHSIGVSGYFSAANGTFWDLARNTYNIDDTFSWTRGRHSLRFGGQISRYQVNQINEFLSRGQFNFNGFASGDALADFMLGRVNSLRQVSTLANNLRQTLWHFFAQDDFKVTSRFTLNIGVRWEPNLHFNELSGKLSAFRPGEQSTVFPNAPRGLLFKGDPQLPENVARKRWWNLAPRVAFAYDLTGDGKTAIRGGYGMFYDVIRSINLNRFPLIQPFVVDISVFDVNFSDPYAGRSVFPFDAPRTPEERSRFTFITPAATTSFNEDFRTPYTQQWNINIQRQLPWNIVTTAAYIGSKSSRLFGSHNVNPAIFQPGATVATTQSRRLYPQFGVIEDESTVGYSQYHSMQLTFNKRLSSGFTLLAAYTLSKNTGLVAGQGEGSLGNRNPFNWNLDRGVLNEDRTHVMSVSSVWNLPAFGSTGITRAIVGGWELSGIFYATSGAPLTARAGQDRSLTGQNMDTADLVGDPRLPGGRPRQEELAAWFNKSAFALPAIGTFGTSGINILRGPGSYNLDAGLFRNFRITEAVGLQFRAQFYNALNHTRLNNPDTNFSSANFGRILGAQTPRVGELGLKFIF
jgi:outer membrane receptor protein involved in Fe transport